MYTVYNAEGPVARPKLDEKIRILEGLAASGLRSIRYALEVGMPCSNQTCSTRQVMCTLHACFLGCDDPISFV